MGLADLADEVSRDTPAPGGGSIAAACGSLGAALAAMVANLAQGRAEYASQDSELQDIAEAGQRLKDQLLGAVEDDTKAFEAYMTARRLPSGDAEQKAAREQAMLAGLKLAVAVPLQTALASFEAMRLAERALASGNPASLTDAAVGAASAHAGVLGGLWNVLINPKDIKDPAYVAAMRQTCAELRHNADELYLQLTADVDRRLSAE